MKKSSFPSCRSHALVIGASVGGMCAAVALARHFERVTILERDELPEQPCGRRGVPQSLQPHGFLLRGRAEVEALFPGLMKTLIERGAFEFNGVEQIGRFTAHGWLPRYLGLSANAFACSRPLLELTMRELLLAQNLNVRIVQGVRAQAPVFEREAGCVWVRGVRTDSEQSELRELRADLVVDASGRGSVAARWFSEMQLPEPEVVRVDAKCNYATRYYRAPEGSEHWWWKALLIDNAPPRLRRACSILRVEGGRFIVTAIGSGGDYAPTDEAGWLEFMKSLRSPIAYEVLRDAEPLTEVIQSRSTHNVWRKMHRYRGPLSGLLLVADAVCGYNPSYGQGMTAAALTAKCLHEALASHEGPLDAASLAQAVPQHRALLGGRLGTRHHLGLALARSGGAKALGAWRSALADSHLGARGVPSTQGARFRDSLLRLRHQPPFALQPVVLGSAVRRCAAPLLAASIATGTDRDGPVRGDAGGFGACLPRTCDARPDGVKTRRMLRAIYLTSGDRGCPLRLGTQRGLRATFRACFPGQEKERGSQSRDSCVLSS